MFLNMKSDAVSGPCWGVSNDIIQDQLCTPKCHNSVPRLTLRFSPTWAWLWMSLCFCEPSLFTPGFFFENIQGKSYSKYYATFMLILHILLIFILSAVLKQTSCYVCSHCLKVLAFRQNKNRQREANQRGVAWHLSATFFKKKTWMESVAALFGL